MNRPKIGSICSGVGGLDLAVEEFFDADTAWFAEYDAEPSKVLAVRWPGIPNHGDITVIDWTAIEPVDIICGGTPCQDVSAAGRRRGMTEGTRSNLWVAMRDAVAAIKPSVVIWENVRGSLSAYAASDVESEPGLLGVPYGPGRPALRAAGRVVGDLSDLGYDAVWTTLPASDVGAPHQRFRIFVVAYCQGIRLERFRPARKRRTGLTNGRGGAPVALLPTPSAANPNDGEDIDQWTTRREKVKASGVNGNGFGIPLGVAVRLLPTTGVADAMGGHESRSGTRGGELLLPGLAKKELRITWGEYEPAIRRWESVTRPAPTPTEPDGRNGQHRLSARFTEWMMGWDDGWVTDILGRNPAIKACGNGVVTRQALEGISRCWSVIASLTLEATA